MNRIVLNNGKWFDADKSIKFDEKTYWNGNNHISIPTGSQWDHEALYYTKSGNWVLHQWSQWQGSLPTYDPIDESDAVTWLIVNECFDELEQLPNSVHELVEEHLAKEEV